MSPVGLLGFRAHALPATLCTQVTSVCTTASGVNAPCRTITRVGWRTVMKTVFLEVGMCEKTVGGHVLQAKNLTQGEPWEERTWGLSPTTAGEPSLHSPRAPVENHTHTSFPTTSLKPNFFIPTQAPPLPEGPVGSRPPQTEPPSISAAVYTTSSWVGLSAAQKDELLHDVLFPNDATVPGVHPMFYFYLSHRS